MNATPRRLRRTASTTVGAAALLLALGLGAPAGAHVERVSAAKPDCEQTPDACKVATTGQRVLRTARLASVGRSRCRDATVERWGKSAAGIKLWSWYLDVNWCYRRGRITSASADPRPDTHVPLWSFDKQLAFRKTGGKRQSSFRVFAQGQFQLCITKLGCIQDAQPWIRVTTRGDGSWNYNAGG
jgi:hypothetical protein